MYLSQAFVLSWSLVEIMASGTPVLAEDNQMMEELIKPSENGALWNKDRLSLAKNILELIQEPETLKKWGQKAREDLDPTYTQEYCVDKLEKLLLSQAKCF